MRQVTYVSNTGKRYDTLIPDDAPDSEAGKGIPIGPPDLPLDLPRQIAIELHNQLHSRKIFTLQDAMQRRQELYNALMATLKLDVDSILTAFANTERGNDNG